VPEPLLSTADWFASLSTVYLSASMLITDPDDRILLVKPNYRPDWGIPGGIVEADEAPDQCATREIAEELGLDIPAGDLLVVDWVAAAQDRPQAIMNFIFDGGVLADPGAIRRGLGRGRGPDGEGHGAPGARRPSGPAEPPHRVPSGPAPNGVAAGAIIQRGTRASPRS
jgi:ADP-ribose pyrophosphatase YjhB (NUDIX family)